MSDPVLDRSQRWRAQLAVTALVFASFMAFSAVRSPVPGVNEPHYLTKAKHYWNPDWIRGDFFLDSSDAHLVFYQTIGALTQWFTLEQTAWIGRAIGLALLAVGWNSLVSQIVRDRWAPLWSAWIFLSLAAIGNFSGEWVVGGVEAKVLSYAFVFWAISFVLRAAFARAATCAGLAISFHPIVGVWAVAAGVFATLIEGWFRWRRRELPPVAAIARRGVISALLLVVCALPGVAPALGIIDDASARTALLADVIQVFFRLPHHLDPAMFAPFAYAFYGALGVFWLVGRRWASRTDAERWFAWFVVGSVLIAAAGMLIRIGARPPAEVSSSDVPYWAFRVRLMKFYPFRLFDVMLPMAVAIAAAGLIARACVSQRWLRPVVTLLLAIITAGLSVAMPSSGGFPRTMDRIAQRDWRDVCRWFAQSTPSDTIVVTPHRQSFGFKWFAERREFVAWKDCPQDAEGVLEWERRSTIVNTWSQEGFTDGYTLDELRALAVQTDADYLVARRLGPVHAEPVYRNETYRVYALPRE